MTAAKSKPKKKPAQAAAAKNGVPASTDVLTLPEAAAYLRVTEAELLQSVRTQKLPGREISGQWRFLKSSRQDWLRSSQRKAGNEAFLALAGSWKDDPYIDEMLEEIYKQRGRPMLEEKN